MVKSDKPIVNLAVSINKEIYIIGILRLNKEGFSYFFTHTESSPKKHFFCNTEEYVDRMNHVTWHQSVTHMKNDGNMCVSPRKSFVPLFSDNRKYPFVFVESFYPDQTNFPAVRECNFSGWQGSCTQTIIDLEPAEGFSMIFLLVPREKSDASIFYGLELTNPKFLFGDLCDIRKAGRIQLAWWKYDLIIATTDVIYQIPTSIPKQMGSFYRMCNYQAPEMTVCDLMIQKISA